MPKPHSTDISNLKCYYSLLPHLNLLCQQKTGKSRGQMILETFAQHALKPKAATKNTMSYTSQSNSKKKLKQRCGFGFLEGGRDDT